MRYHPYKILSLFLLGLALPLAVQAYDPKDIRLRADETPKELQNIGIDEKIGHLVDPSLTFLDDQGTLVTLGRYLNGNKPVLLTIVYYSCANLCNFHLNGVTEALQQIKLRVGKEFDVVAVSMDSREGPAVAAAKKENYVKFYGFPETESGWHFLTGTKENIQHLADSVGFKFRWDEESQQFAHSSAAILITPGGKISRYIHGIQPHPQDMRLSILEAAEGKVGTLADQFMMYCFKFDPKKSKYTLAAWNIMRIGVVLMVLILAVIMIPLWLRERRQQGVV